MAPQSIGGRGACLDISCGHAKSRFPAPLEHISVACSDAVAIANPYPERLIMSKARLEAFTDGVIAIVITIMVLELTVPSGSSFRSLVSVLPVFLAYALSFANVGIFWNNHHHMLHASDRINGTVLWANLFFLFWISLVPFAIRWMDKAHFASAPTASYGIVLAMCSIAYILLERSIIKCNGPHSRLARAVGSDLKGQMSLLIYLLAIALAFLRPWIAIALYVAIALIWFVPDRRIESTA
jgi:TMEM175 potassium channel family protein